MTELLTEKGFVDWLAKTPVGARIDYYEGALFVDRYLHQIKYIGANLDLKTMPPMSKTADLVYEESLVGNVHLFQRRTSPGIFRYIVEKASPTWKNRMTKVFWKRSRFGVKKAA